MGKVVNACSHLQAPLPLMVGGTVIIPVRREPLTSRPQGHEYPHSRTVRGTSQVPRALKGSSLSGCSGCQCKGGGHVSRQGGAA